MRALFAAGLGALALLSAPASAQERQYAGTWAFMTAPYGDERFGVMMSGAATFTATAPGRYDIRLIANEMIVERASGSAQTITARQTCTGESDGAQFVISCQLAEPLEGYAPDNFILQQGELDQLVGVLSSNASAQVTFSRMR
jgi:hypothetical protein